MDRDNDVQFKSNRRVLPDNIHFERSQAVCQKCGRVFGNFIFEEIEDKTQLRCGDVLIPHAKMVCMHCGWVFYWDARDRDLAKLAVTYGELMVAIKRYNPE